MSRWWIGLVFLFAVTAQAEYRVFRLVITDSASGTQREVLSTLDPFQYIGYHPLKLTEGINYTDTWRCFEDNSGFESYCPSPRTKKNEESTSLSSETPKS